LSFVAACAGKQSLPEAAAPASVPNRVLGIVLREPLNAQAVSYRRCVTGRSFAYEDGDYDIVTDDILFSAPEEHQDTSAVLASLDLFAACRVHTRELNATAIITLSDSVVEHALIYWPDGDAPVYDSVLATLTQAYGEPFQNAWGVRYWSGDSMAIYLNKRSIFGAGTEVTLSDARLCERYEGLVHRNNSRDRRSYPCWKEPQRLDPGEIFTERPVALADSDLVAAGVAYLADSAQVRRTLGAPASRDSIFWTYSGVRIRFYAGPVTQIALTTPQYATARGLRVGDRVARAKALYGTPCMRELWIYCRTVPPGPDGRGMTLEVKDHIITEIRVGAAFALQ
jgi:hypothetical protein